MSKSGPENPRHLHALHRANKWLRKVGEAEMAPFGLHPLQGYVMHLIHDAGEDGLPLSTLAKHLTVSPARVTHLIDDCERDGLAIRERDPEDRRVWRVKLTPKGRELHEILHPRHMAMEDWLVSCFSDEEFEQLSALLDRLVEHLKGRFGQTEDEE